jgi:hypothetical protein
MNIAVRVEQNADVPAGVEYRWDADTEILTANVGSPRESEENGGSGTVGLEGNDGSWVILDVSGGHIRGVEVAVWPNLRKLKSLSLPTQIQDAVISLPDAEKQSGVASLEMDTSLVAESDQAKRNIHFRVGKPRRVKTVRIASDLLIDIDSRSRIAGVWLLNVPPCPEAS